MKRVMVIGAGGTGKTAFARELAEKTGLPLVRAPRRREDGTPRARDDVLADWEAARPTPGWIVDESDLSAVPGLLARADTVFFFDFSPTLCARNAFRRSREDGAKRLGWKSCWRIWTGTRRRCGALRRMIKQADVRAVVFTKGRQVRDYLAGWGMRNQNQQNRPKDPS